MNFNSLNIFAVADWVANSFPTIRVILIVALLVLSLVLIICILMQSSTSKGMGAIAGQTTETFYSKNKGRTLQGILRRATVILSICILVITVMYLISVQIYNADLSSVLKF